MLTSTVTIAAEESVNPLIPTLPDLVWGTLAFIIVLAFFFWKVLPAIGSSAAKVAAPSTTLRLSAWPSCKDFCRSA